MGVNFNLAKTFLKIFDVLVIAGCVDEKRKFLWSSIIN